MVEPRSFRLNAMQTLMRRFTALAPYNFIHVMHLAAPAEVHRWREAAECAVAQLGLGAPRFAGDQVCFRSTPRLTVEMPEVSLDAHLDAELNRAFSPDDLPIRFFLREEADHTHWFGIVLDHWLADDYSCRQLLQRIFLRYHSPEEAAALPPLALAEATTQGTGLSLLRSLPSVIAQLARQRNAFRVSLRDPRDFAVRTFQHHLPPGLIDPLRLRARQRNATVHDSFLAACAQSCGEFRQGQPPDGRPAIGLATVADLRRFLHHDATADTAFGCSLSYYTLAIGHPEKRPAAEVLAGIASQTKRFKARLRTGLANIEWARIWWDHSRGTRARATLLHRGVPTMCGLSNVNLIGSWIDRAYPQLLDYRRIGPAGPITPLVFMLTSIGDRLSVNVTYRTTAFTPGDAELLADRFSVSLQSLAA